MVDNYKNHHQRRPDLRNNVHHPHILVPVQQVGFGWGGVKDWEFEDLLHTGKVTAGSPKSHPIEKENHLNHPPPWLWGSKCQCSREYTLRRFDSKYSWMELDLLPFHPNSKWIWNQNPLLKPPWKGSVCQAICQIILVSSMEVSSDS